MHSTTLLAIVLGPHAQFSEMADVSCEAQMHPKCPTYVLP